MRTRFSGQPSSRAISVRTNEGPWARAVDGDAGFLPVRDRGERLEREMQAPSGCGRCARTRARPAAKALSTSPRRSLKSSAILVPLRPLRCLRSAKVPAGLSSVVHQDPVLGRLDLVEDRRQLLVFGDDELRRLLGDMRIGGEHDRDRLADIVHLADGEDRLVVEGRAVIGLRDDLADVLGGDHAVDAGHLLGGADVDRLDAAVGDRAAEDLARAACREAAWCGCIRRAR